MKAIKLSEPLCMPDEPEDYKNPKRDWVNWQKQIETDEFGQPMPFTVYQGWINCDN
jgi:hypothetical protein